MAEKNNRLSIATAEFAMLIENKEISKGFKASIDEVIVEDELNMPTMFSVSTAIFHEMQLEENGTVKKQRINNDLFNKIVPGQDVTLKMGKSAKEGEVNEPLQTMVKGEIACLEPDFSKNPRLVIRGYDGLYRLRFGTKRKAFKNIKDSALASRLASENKLGADVEDTEVVHPFLWQNNQSDYEFLLERAERLDYEFLVENGKLRFFSPRENADPVIELKFQDDLVEFHARLKTITQGNEVDVRAPGYRRNKTISSKARSGDERNKPVSGRNDSRPPETGFKVSTDGFQSSPIAVMDEPLVDFRDAELLARAKYNRILKNYITGEGRTTGNSLIRAGKTIRLSELGEKFSGVYYITSTVHTWRSGEYSTTFKVRRANI